jgi:hypothetical protein
MSRHINYGEASGMGEIHRKKSVNAQRLIYGKIPPKQIPERIK